MFVLAQGVDLNNAVLVVPSLRMSGCIPPFTHSLRGVDRGTLIPVSLHKSAIPVYTFCAIGEMIIRYEHK